MLHKKRRGAHPLRQDLHRGNIEVEYKDVVKAYEYEKARSPGGLKLPSNEWAKDEELKMAKNSSTMAAFPRQRRAAAAR